MNINKEMNLFQNKVINIGDNKLSYYANENSSNKAIIYVHGAGCNAKIFSRLANELTNCNHYLLDLPGHGNSKGLDPMDTVDEYSQTILDFANTIKKENRYSEIILIGHSLGGAIVLSAVTKDTCKIINKCISIGGIAEDSFITSEILNAVGNDEIFNQILLNDTRSFSQKDANYLMENILEFTENTDIRVKDFNSAIGHDISEAIKDVKAEILVICGDRDTIVPVSQQFFINNTATNVQMLVIPNSGHFLLIESDKMKYFKNTIENFIC